MGAYVIKEWDAEDTPDDLGRYVSIYGRRAGLTSWILSLVGIDPIVSIDVYESKFVFESTSLSGMVRRTIPLGRGMISSMMYGYSKPFFSALFLILFSLFGGLAIIHDWESMALGVSVIAAGCIVAGLHYFLNKALTLGIVEVGGIATSIKFKRSVIENQNINESDAERVVDIIQMLADRHAGQEEG